MDTFPPPLYELRFDGLFREAEENTQAGLMGLGWLLTRGGKVVAHAYGITARGVDATSNMAEYLALIDGLQAMVDMGLDDHPVKVMGDARVVICQMTGESRVTAPRLISVHRRARTLARKLQIVEWAWIPRKLNKAADLLTRRALREVTSDEVAFQAAWTRLMRDHTNQRKHLYTLGGMMVLNGRND
ncbi:MAG TPA: ribonuclease HI family protein [Anaerolineales bacterium]|nr:ribonuclease HI family protein [Anaerolineales bacterium]